MPQETNMAEIVRLLNTAIGKLDGLATDVRNLDVRLELVEGTVDRLEVKVDRLEVKVDRLEVKVDGLEVKVDGLEVKVDGLEVKVDGLEVSVGRLEGKTDSIAETVMKNDRRLIAVEHQIETGI